MHLPGPQLQGHLLWLSSDVSDCGCCNQADRRGDEKREGQYITVQPLRLTTPFILPPSRNGEEKISNFWKTAIMGWNRNKILLIFKRNWVFMESDSLWINIILSVEMAQFDTSNNMHFWGSCFKPSVVLQSQTDWSFWKRLHRETATYCCLVCSAGLFPASQTMRRHEIMPADRSDWLLSFLTSFSSFVLLILITCGWNKNAWRISVTGGCSDSAQSPWLLEQFQTSVCL